MKSKNIYFNLHLRTPKKLVLILHSIFGCLVLDLNITSFIAYFRKKIVERREAVLFMYVLCYKIDWDVIRKIAVVWVDSTIITTVARVHSSHQLTHFRTSCRQCGHHCNSVHTHIPLSALLLSILQKNTKLVFGNNLYQQPLRSQFWLVSATDGWRSGTVLKNTNNTYA